MAPTQFRRVESGARLTHLTIALGFLMVGCEAGTQGLEGLPTGGDLDASFKPDASPDGGGPDASVWPDAGRACTEPNPAGCTVNACPPTLVCDQRLGCTSSSCECIDGDWNCTRDCGGGLCRPTELTFRFSYASDVIGEEAVVQSSGGTPWVSVLDSSGVDLFMDANCGLCPCDQCGSCPVCGFAPPTTANVGPGHPIERRWDLITHPQRRCPTAPGSSLGCQDYQPLPEGHYFARFCFGYRALEAGGGSYVDRPTCVDVPFDWPTTETVIEHAQCDCG